MSASTPSVVQLQRAIKIAEKIQELEAELASILGGSKGAARSIAASVAGVARATGKRRYTFSAATLAKRAGTGDELAGEPAVKQRKKRKGMSAEGRAAIVAAQKARWAKIKEGKGGDGSKAASKKAKTSEK